MATLGVPLSVLAGTSPDGSSGNAAPAKTKRMGSETNPKKAFTTADFDASTNEYLWFNTQVPQNYASGGAVRLNWMANATSGSVVWGSRVGAVTPTDADTPVEHAEAAATTATTAVNTTEARRLTQTSITLGNLDSMAAGDELFILVYRDAANGADTCSVDAELISAAFEYTST